MTAKPRLLDLFCGAGGCAKGYQRAGFYVVGVDINPQPNYCGDEFYKADALDVLGNLLGPGPFDQFDAIHASPPCQAHTSMQSVAKNAAAHEDLIGRVRDLLKQTGLPYVIENVVGARLKMDTSLMLCGSMFGLGAETHLGWLELRRHRLFESESLWLVPGPCRHSQGQVIGIYGDHARSNRRHGLQSQFNMADGLRYGREAMQMPWATWRELAEAIPPAYTEHIGRQLLSHLKSEVTA